MPDAQLIRKELDERAANNLIDLVANTATLVFQQSFDYTTDFPGFIASPVAEPGPFGVAKAIAQQSCRRWARGEGIPSLPGFDGFYGSICGPYLDSLGENPGDGNFGRDFDGGQCPDVPYLITWTINAPGFPPSNQQSDRPGPLRLSRALEPGDSNAQCSPGQTFRRYTMLSGGTPLGLASGCDVTVTNIQVSPLFGLPNNCGSNAPGYLPPGVPTGLPPLQPVVVNVPGIGPVAVDVTFDDDGNINVSLPDLGIDLTIPNPLGGNDDGGDGGDDIPGDQGQPGLPAFGGGGEAAEGGDENRVLLGVRVNLLDYPPRANQIFNETETYTKGAYFVYLGGDGGYEQIPSAAIAREEQFYTAPDGCNRFRVVPNVGFAIQVTPYYERED